MLGSIYNELNNTCIKFRGTLSANVSNSHVYQYMRTEPESCWKDVKN